MSNYYAVKTVSAVNPFRHCVLGTGESEDLAIEDAYGCSAKSARKQMKRANAWVVEIDEDEYLDSM